MRNSLAVRTATSIAAFVLAGSLLGAVAATAPKAFAAPQCMPLDLFVADADKIDMPLEIVMSEDHGGFVEVYHKTLGVAPPADSDPIGMLYVVVGPDKVFIGLIERGGCVKYTAIIPLVMHEKALAAAKMGA